jgi:hypothetical protein
VAFYGDCVKFCEDFAPDDLYCQKNLLLHHDNAPSQTFFFTREFLAKNNMTVFPHPHYFSLLP